MYHVFGTVNRIIKKLQNHTKLISENYIKQNVKTEETARRLKMEERKEKH